MPGCINDCYLYEEEYSILFANHEEQMKIERQLKNLEEGKSFDPAVLNYVVKRTCLGNFIKEIRSPDELRGECKFHRHIPGDLTVPERINILNEKSTRKWKWITLIVTIIGMSLSSFFAILSFSKPSSEELKKENVYLEERITKYDEVINKKNDVINKLKQELKDKKSGVKDE